MQLKINDWIGFAGVAILLIAFLLNLLKQLPATALTYILMNMIGAAMACLASWLIHYIPFVILEGTWTLVSALALINYLRKKIN